MWPHLLMIHLYVCKETKIIQFNFQKSHRGKILSFTNASNTETHSSKSISETATVLIRQVNSGKRAECAPTSLILTGGPGLILSSTPKEMFCGLSKSTLLEGKVHRAVSLSPEGHLQAASWSFCLLKMKH